MVEPITIIAPEGTVVNCRFPAAVGSGVHTVGTLITEVTHECVAKMLFAAGLYEDVNSSWFGFAVVPIFGGVNQFGDTFGGMTLDGFAAGIGATPERDVVDTGGVMMDPTSNVSDVEMIEMNLPFVYLGRKQAMDSGGFGMFGGYATALQETRFAHNSKIREWFKESRSPASFQDLEKLEGKLIDTPHCFPVRPINNYDLIANRGCAGGGYGDPLDRSPEKVCEDVRMSVISPDTAGKVYGVVMNPETFECNASETEALGKKIREEKIKEGKQLKDRIQFNGKNKTALLRIHENLEVVEKEDHKKVIRCIRCGYDFCESEDNYKLYSLLRERTLTDIRLRSLISGDPIFVLYQEYICPECGTLLEVDNYSTDLDKGGPILWDIQVKN